MKKMKTVTILFVMSNIICVHGMDMILAEKRAEFVNRTQKMSCSKLYTHYLSNYFIEPHGAGVGYYVMCPNDMHHALLRPAEKERKAQLVVLTATANAPFGVDVYARQFLGYKRYLAVALAAQRDLFATIHETPECEIVKIRKIDTKKTLKKISIPKYFEIASTFNANSALAFNKQGTEVIVWGVHVIRNGGESYRGKPHGAPALDYMIYNFEEELEAEKARKQKNVNK